MVYKTNINISHTLYTLDTPQFANRLFTLLNNTVPWEHADFRLSTIHQSKGLEFRRVRLANDFAELLDATKFKKAVELLDEYKPKYIRDEDFNLWYVAVTRAQNILEYNTSFKEFVRKLCILCEAGLLNNEILKDHPCPVTLREMKEMIDLDD